MMLLIELLAVGFAFVAAVVLFWVLIMVFIDELARARAIDDFARIYVFDAHGRKDPQEL